ncbi:MAG: hypothetical protein V1835_06705, partial [Candidatus Micrarchaeota archaeon]
MTIYEFINRLSIRTVSQFSSERYSNALKDKRLRPAYEQKTLVQYLSLPEWGRSELDAMINKAVMMLGELRVEK